MTVTTVLWAAMLLFGAILWRVSPRVSRPEEFFQGRDQRGREVRMTVLIASVVISWIFAKSITNSANLGRSFGIVGSIAYAGWYLSIPVAGVVIWWIRRTTRAKSLPEFVTSRYGRAAGAAFLLVVLVRLMNEVWSNTAVVGSYFGASGSTSYLAAALVFTAITLGYSLRGGLRSSIVTDVVQMVLGVFLLVFVIALIVPRQGATALVTTGSWTLAGGVDLLLVAVLQSLSYPFHDPVLTDRAFLTRPRVMLRGYIAAGLISAAFIVLFGLVGVHARLEGIVADQDAPIRVAQAFGIASTAVMTVLMMVSAGSTLDSTLSSVSKALVLDAGASRPSSRGRLPGQADRWISAQDPVRLGRIAMVLATALGSIPLFAGAEIIKATTVSGTMVLGLAPVFLLFFVPWAGRWAFHLAFWPGLVIGALHAFDAVPQGWAVGGGSYASLLGANLVGTVAVFGGFAVGCVLDRLVVRARRRGIAAATSSAVLVALVGLSTPAHAEPDFDLGGQTMFRLTSRMADLERPGAEVYNVRLLGTLQEDPYEFVVETRFRQTKLRSYSPSNVWLQQAFGRWHDPQHGLSVSAGLIYDQLGIFWDGSWFGNLLYLAGHKLDPDMNLEVAWSKTPDEGFGWQSWLQISPGEDGLNGSFTTARRADLLDLGVPDPEVDAGTREALALRTRLRPIWRRGDWKIAPGFSFQRSALDRTTDITTRTGSQTVIGGEFTVRWKELDVFAETLHESIDDVAGRDLSRDYWLAGFQLPVWHSRHLDVRGASIGASWQTVDHEVEDFGEWFLTARIATRINELLGFTVEYVRWEVDRFDSPELDRLEFIAHVHY